ncbi:Uncharacterised protein [Chlamydia trachomatis]|nr:Uncharacterised protein [Chlamydia trachomatis]SYV92152.1 Uncharacterised protein [Mesomycoplasma hyorhinis]
MVTKITNKGIPTTDQPNEKSLASFKSNPIPITPAAFIIVVQRMLLSNE